MHCDRYLAARVLQAEDGRFRIAQPQLRCYEEGATGLEHVENARVPVLVLLTLGALAAIVAAFVVGTLNACHRANLSANPV